MNGLSVLGDVFLWISGVGTGVALALWYVIRQEEKAVPKRRPIGFQLPHLTAGVGVTNKAHHES